MQEAGPNMDWLTDGETKGERRQLKSIGGRNTGTSTKSTCAANKAGDKLSYTFSIGSTGEAGC